MIERFKHYLLVDHRTRWRNDLLCALASLALYTICVSEGIEGETAFKISTALLFFTVSSTTFWYCIAPELAKKREYLSVPASEMALSRRTLFLRLGKQLAAAAVLAILGKFTTPSLEAGIVDTRLRWAVHGEPNRDKIEKAVQIVKEARDNNFRVSPHVISQVGQKIVNSAALPDLQKTAVEAANQFASYQSALLPVPLIVYKITTLNATPEHGTPISLTIGCAQVRIGGQARLSNIFGFAGFNLGNCSDVVVWPAKPAMLQLDNVDGTNATFLNCTLTYNGGKLTLENVRFVNCIFQISDAYARNQNVLQLLTAALTGQPIHLELTVTWIG